MSLSLPSLFASVSPLSSFFHFVVMSAHHGEVFFEALFGFREADYVSTRHQLFRKCAFEVQRRCTVAGTQQVYKERALFEHPKLGKQHLVSSGWHSTPSVAELRAETVDLVRIFERHHPGLLASLRDAQQAEGKAAGSLRPSVPTTNSTLEPSHAPWVRCSHTIGESGDLHRRFPNAFFQVASQFNSLEFISASVTPEAGVTHYVYDRTQGPACALACMGGTAYRNYLLHPDLFDREAAAMSGEVGEAGRGQQASHQLNLLGDFTSYLTSAHGAPDAAASAVPAVEEDFFYRIENGYFFPAPTMSTFPSRLAALANCYGATREDAEDALVARLRVAIVEDATVTLPLHNCDDSVGGDHRQSTAVHSLRDVHVVSQSYNSAVSLHASSAAWSPEARSGVEAMARLVLRGTYEATLLAGVQHTLRSLERRSSASASVTLPPIFLTKVGGGVFHNDAAWIAAAMEAAVCRVKALGVPLDVRLVHYRAVEPFYAAHFSSWPTEPSR